MHENASAPTEKSAPILLFMHNIQKNRKNQRKIVYFSHKIWYNIVARGKILQVLERSPDFGTVKTMKITIYAKQMTVRESLRAVIEKKLAKFDKFFGDSTEAFVTCKVRKGVKIIEITVNYGATLFRSEEESDTFMTALDRAVEGLERQMRKNKTRLEK